MTSPVPMPFPAGLAAPGTEGAPWQRLAAVGDLPVSGLLRVSRGDLDLLLARTPAGLVAVDDRCPHMSAPLSLGQLEGCVVACPLHRGRFDLCRGDVVQFPTTGGLDADGVGHPPWSAPGSSPKAEPSDEKARARALTRVRRLRYYPLRVVGDAIEVRLP